MARCENLTEALKGIIDFDRSWVIKRHQLKTNEVVHEHWHNKAKEYIYIDNGRFTISIDSQTRSYFLLNQPTMIFIPRKQHHSLSAQTPLDYFVIQDKRDRNSYKQPAKRVKLR